MTQTQEGKKPLVEQRAEIPIGTRQIANRLLVAVGLPVVVLTACALSLFFFNLDPSERRTAWAFIVALVLLIAGFVQYYLSHGDTKALYEDVRQILYESSTQTKDEVRTIIQQNIDPRMTILRSKAEVRSAASQMITIAIKEKHECGVIYFGAAALSPTIQEVREALHLEGHEFSDVLLYNNSQDDLKNSSIRLIRYINLGDEEVFALRSLSTRQHFLTWFEIQVARLKTNPNYTLYDARRAPEWGGPRSSIITKNSMLDIIGDGCAGWLLTSQRMPMVLYGESKAHFWAAKEDRNKPQMYTFENIQQLERRLGAFRAVHQERLKSDSKAKEPEIRPAA